MSTQITNRTFLGCFPCDQLPDPNSLPLPTSLIVNLDPHQLPGSHWVAIFAYGLNKNIIYFDSLALPRISFIDNFLNVFPGIMYNQKSYQSISSKSCAHFCICFVYFLSIGFTYDQFISKLNDLTNPELFVQYFVRNFAIKN